MRRTDALSLARTLVVSGARVIDRPANTLRALSDDELAEREQDVRFDRSGPMNDSDRARLRAILDEMRRRNALAPASLPAPFEGL